MNSNNRLLLELIWVLLRCWVVSAQTPDSLPLTAVFTCANKTEALLMFVLVTAMFPFHCQRFCWQKWISGVCFFSFINWILSGNMSKCRGKTSHRVVTISGTFFLFRLNRDTECVSLYWNWSLVYLSATRWHPERSLVTPAALFCWLTQKCWLWKNYFLLSAYI